MIRAATEDDIPAIHALWNHAIRDTLVTFNSTEKTLDEVTEALRGFDACFVAARDGQVVGYVAYGAFRTGAGYAHTKEHSIILAPDARGVGLGRGLMQALEEHARDAGVHSLIAGISGSNPMGEPFHTALGFVKVGGIPEAGHKFGTWHDLVLMQKTL